MSIYFFLLIFTIFFLIIARVNHYADKENWLKPNIPTRFKLNTTYSDPLYFNNKNDRDLKKLILQYIDALGLTFYCGLYLEDEEKYYAHFSQNPDGGTSFEFTTPKSVT